MEQFWVAARTKTQREKWAADNVARQGGTYYLPRLKPGKLYPPGKLPPCLFPSYLFVQTEGQWRYLLGTFGISGLVMQGGKPAILPSAAIEQIKSREGSDGLVRLPDAPTGRFKAGDAVRVTEGAFSGFRGIYQNDGAQARVEILLEYLGAKRKVLIGEDSLEIAV
jgi:transcriptional antiterminator RfaH